MFSVPSQPGETKDQRVGEFKSRSEKTRDASFYQAMKAWKP